MTWRILTMQTFQQNMAVHVHQVGSAHPQTTRRFPLRQASANRASMGIASARRRNPRCTAGACGIKYVISKCIYASIRKHEGWTANQHLCLQQHARPARAHTSCWSALSCSSSFQMRTSRALAFVTRSRLCREKI